MSGSRRALCSFLLSSLFVLGSCAEGTKVDLPSEGGGAPGGAGGAKGTGMVAALGGVPSQSVTVTRPTTSGSGSGGLETQGGKGGHQGGAALGYAGGIAISPTGGGSAATVVAPSAGPAIRIVQQKSSISQNETATDFLLVNMGPGALELATITVKYYFTIDAWVTPVFEIDHAGQLITKSEIKYSLFTIDPPRTDADRYFEISFVGGSVPASGEVQINSRLHEQTWRVMTVANDYSYIGGSGFTERITIFAGQQLVWGTEPEPIFVPGAGGASGIAGASGVGAGGTHSSIGDSGGAAGALGLAGVAGS
ncbi:MAG TPA: cellulose binding domain-containing protein [Polyangiaceae bacterium]|nr:cellulose binding domain-containing protein [Polyangiaceae bacterium]